jgi:hypothetical protein
MLLRWRTDLFCPSIVSCFFSAFRLLEVEKWSRPGRDEARSIRKCSEPARKSMRRAPPLLETGDQRDAAALQLLAAGLEAGASRSETVGSRAERDKVAIGGGRSGAGTRPRRDRWVVEWSRQVDASSSDMVARILKVDASRSETVEWNLDLDASRSATVEWSLELDASSARTVGRNFQVGAASVRMVGRSLEVDAAGVRTVGRRLEVGAAGVRMGASVGRASDQ